MRLVKGVNPPNGKRIPQITLARSFVRSTFTCVAKNVVRVANSISHTGLHVCRMHSFDRRSTSYPRPLMECALHRRLIHTLMLRTCLRSRVNNFCARLSKFISALDYRVMYRPDSYVRIIRIVRITFSLNVELVIPTGGFLSLSLSLSLSLEGC